MQKLADSLLEIWLITEAKWYSSEKVPTTKEVLLGDTNGYWVLNTATPSLQKPSTKPIDCQSQYTLTKRWTLHKSKNSKTRHTRDVCHMDAWTVLKQLPSSTLPKMLRIMTFNTRSIRDFSKRKEIFDLIDTEYDFAILTEKWLIFSLKWLHPERSIL